MFKSSLVKKITKLRVTTFILSTRSKLTKLAVGLKPLKDRSVNNFFFVFFFTKFSGQELSSKFIVVYLNLVLKGFKSKFMAATLHSLLYSGGLNYGTRPDSFLNKSIGSLHFYQTLNDYFFAPTFFTKINKNSRWLSMEEIITHFIFYSEGPSLPSGFSQGGVEAPKGHLAVSVVSRGGNKI
jgi:uncharacterized membrane protein YhaH (DUF805 family)